MLWELLALWLDLIEAALFYDNPSSTFHTALHKIHLSNSFTGAAESNYSEKCCRKTLKSPKNLKMRLEGNERLHPPSIQQAVPDPRGPAGSLKPTEDCFLRLLGRYFWAGVWSWRPLGVNKYELIPDWLPIVSRTDWAGGGWGFFLRLVCKIQWVDHIYNGALLFFLNLDKCASAESFLSTSWFVQSETSQLSPYNDVWERVEVKTVAGMFMKPADPRQ